MLSWLGVGIEPFDQRCFEDILHVEWFYATEFTLQRDAFEC